MTTRYVVAVSREEAELLADAIGCDTKDEALGHLRDVQSPPTDPFYAQQYTVYRVEKSGG